MPEPLADRAPAKINLTLRVIGRRGDGYHEIESLVAFAGLRDRLSLAPGGELALTVAGPTAAQAGADADNLVLKAARALAARIPTLGLGAFVLDKELPVAAGLGGGSADAAAALRLLGRANGLAGDDPRLGEAARATGADVPVCLDPRVRVMRGIGEVLSAPLDLPPLPAVLANPGVALATKAVFAGWRPRAVQPAEIAAAMKPGSLAQTLDWLGRQSNDLEDAAIDAQAGDRRSAGGAARTSRLQTRPHVRLGRDVLCAVCHGVRSRSRGEASLRQISAVVGARN